MKDILIIAHFTQVPGEKGNSRFKYIAEMLSKKKHMKIELVTTEFSHRTKKMRSITTEQRESMMYDLTMIKEPGYKRNVSLRRFYSHYIMGKNLKRYLKQRKKPDIIYCAVPSLDVANVASRYAKQNNIKFIIDVQDLWPEAFKMILNLPIISNLVFKPMEILANNIYKRADEVIAVSNTYLDRVMKVNKKATAMESIFLGTDISYFDSLSNNSNYNVNKLKGELWITYIGTLGHSYDLVSVMNALNVIHQKGITNLKFMVIGDGPLKEQFMYKANELNINVEFTGRLEYGEMVSYLKQSDIAVNPIRKGAAGSIINKVGDYAAAGIPVINTQENQEYRDLLDDYECGINCENGNELDLIDSIMLLYNNEDLRKKMGKNSRRLAEEKFDRSKSYPKITSIISKGVS